MSPIAAPSFFLAFTPKISPWSSRRARDSTEPPDFGCSADLLVLRVAKELQQSSAQRTRTTALSENVDDLGITGTSPNRKVILDLARSSVFEVTATDGLDVFELRNPNQDIYGKVI